MSGHWLRIRSVLVQQLKNQALLLGIAAGLDYFLTGRISPGTTGLMWATMGLFMIAFALMSALGTWGATRDVNYQIGLTMTSEITQRVKDADKDMDDAYSFLSGSVGIGLLAIIGGLLVGIVLG